MFTIKQEQSETLFKNMKAKLKKVLDEYTKNYIQTSKAKPQKPIVFMSDIDEKVP